MEISKADWKLYRERVSDWQEHYMEQLIKEYVELLTSPGNASDHFGELEKRIKQDKKHLDVSYPVLFAFQDPQNDPKRLPVM